MSSTDPLSNAPFSPPPSAPIPTRTLGSVTVVDTPLVRAAVEHARAHCAPWAFKHVVRSWLFGALLLSHADSALREAVDLEVHAVAAVLHDLGWERAGQRQHSHGEGGEGTGGHGEGTAVSADRRFEVDGAMAARAFVRAHPDGAAWSERRVQLVWDAIALHTEGSIARYKEPAVQVVMYGIGMDFRGPAMGVTQEEYDAVLRDFPKGDFRDGLEETLVWLCQTKPQTTYDTWMQPWGEKHVEGYSAVGKRRFDLMWANGEAAGI